MISLFRKHRGGNLKRRFKIRLKQHTDRRCAYIKFVNSNGAEYFLHFRNAFILILISMFLLGVLIYSIYSFIVSIGNADTLRNSLLLVYHVAAFSAMLNIFLFVGLLEIIVSLVLAALSYVIHINTYGDRYYSILNKKTLLFSAICYGISASLMLNALASEYIMNTSAYVLGFMLVFVISFVTLFFKAAVKHAL